MLILGLLLTAGCAGTGRQANVGSEPAAATPQWGQQQVSAGALVFDPPVALADPPLHLPRAPRQSAAFVGFDQLTTTFFHVRIDDRHSSDWTDRYERRAYIERVGARHR